MHALSKLFEALHLTRKDKLSGGHYRRRRRTSRRSSFLSCETLESKQLLAADVAQAFATIELDTTDPVTVAIEGKFQEDTVSGTVVKFETNAPVSDSDIYIELTSDTPLTNGNFLQYVNNDDYDNTFFHRSVDNFVLQGGGFTAPTIAADQAGSDPVAIVTRGTVQNEPGNLNTRGTIAMAKLGGQPDSATSQFFFNLSDNSFLDSDNGGYTAFGEVLGSGMTVVDTMGSALTYDAGTYYSNTTLSELPLWNINQDNIVRPQDFLKIENADVVTESDLMTYVVSSSDAAKLTASFDGNGDLVLTPVGSASGSVTVTVTATSKLDNTTASDVFAVTVNGGGTVDPGPIDPAPVLTAIEEVGNTVLNRDQNGIVYAGDTPMSYRASVPLTESFFSGSSVVAAEDLGAEGKKVVVLNNSNNRIQLWSMPTEWQIDTGIRTIINAGSTAYYDTETQFNIDFDQSGEIGEPIELTPIEESGSTVLNKDQNGNLFAGETPITFNASTPFTETFYNGNSVVAAEDLGAEGKKVVVLNNSNNRIQLWSMPTEWQIDTGIRTIINAGSTAYYDTETQFNIDFDQSGEIGEPIELTPIEESGSTVLNKDQNGNLFAGETPITFNASMPFTETFFNGNSVVAAEDLGAEGKKVVVLNNSNNRIQLWSMPTEWQIGTGIRSIINVGSTAYYDTETQFNIDFDQSGEIGEPVVNLTEIESDGNTTLSKDESNNLYANGNQLYYRRGIPLRTNSITGHTVILAETNEGEGFESVVLRNDANGQIVIYTMTNWTRTTSTKVYENTALFYETEVSFQYDLDGINGIGAPTLSNTETFGKSSLKQAADGTYFADDLPISSSGIFMSSTTLTTHTIEAFEDFGDAGGKQVALMRKTGTELVTWIISNTGRRQTSLPKVYVGTSAFGNTEIKFGKDFDGDGSIGLPGSLISQITLATSVDLYRDTDGLYWIDGFAVNSSGNQISDASLAGYVIHCAANYGESGNRILFMTKGTSLYRWTMSAEWRRTSSLLKVYSGTTEWANIETELGFDLDGNGVGS